MNDRLEEREKEREREKKNAKNSSEFLCRVFKIKI